MLMLISIVDEMTAISNGSSENDFKPPRAWKPIWFRFRYRMGKWAKKQREPRCDIETMDSDPEKAQCIARPEKSTMIRTDKMAFLNIFSKINLQEDTPNLAKSSLCGKITPLGTRVNGESFFSLVLIPHWKPSMEGYICTAWSPPALSCAVTLGDAETDSVQWLCVLAFAQPW